MKEIGYGSFAGCSSLTGIALPEAVTIIRQWAFVDCPLLAKIIIPKAVALIEEEVFMGCGNLTICCRIKEGEKPSDWAEGWNCGCRVVWGYKGE